MKKITSILFILILSTAIMGGCQNSDSTLANDDKNNAEKTENYTYTSFDVLYTMFKNADQKTFDNTNILKKTEAEHYLNMGSYMDNSLETTTIENFISAASTNPMMSVATQDVVVLEFTDDADFDKYMKLMKGIMYKQICVSPDEDTVRIVRNGNFLCYIAADNGEVDNGEVLEKAFMNIDFSSKPSYSSTDHAFDKAAAIYAENKDEYDITGINRLASPLVFISPESLQSDNPELTSDDLSDMYIVQTKTDYETEDQTKCDFASYIIDVKNNEKLNLVKELIEKGLTNDVSYFRQDDSVNYTITTEENFVILTVIK